MFCRRLSKISRVDNDTNGLSRLGSQLNIVHYYQIHLILENLRKIVFCCQSGKIIQYSYYSSDLPSWCLAQNPGEYEHNVGVT